MLKGQVWSCFHKNYTPDKKNFKPKIVVKIINSKKAQVLVNTYNNFFSNFLELDELVLDYRLK